MFKICPNKFFSILFILTKLKHVTFWLIYVYFFFTLVICITDVKNVAFTLLICMTDIKNYYHKFKFI